MKAILDFIANNRVVTIIFAAVVVIAAVVFLIVAAKKKQKKRDKEYAEMFKEVPIVNADTEEINANENLPEFTVHEMDWLKGERGFEGVLRTKLPPVKAQRETEANNPKPTENADAQATRTLRPESGPNNTEKANDESNESAKKQKKSGKKAEKDGKRKTATNDNKETGAAVSTQLSIDDLTEKNADETDEKTFAGASESVKSVKKENIKEEIMKKGSTKNSTAKTEADVPAEKVATEQTVAEKSVTEKTTKEKIIAEKPAADKADKKALGKWIIKEKGEGEFVAYLYANNKEIMLTSETYSSPDGAKKGIATIRKNAAIDENFTYYRDKNKNYFFKLKTSKNRLLCAGETYANKSACLKSIESVKNFVDSPLAEKIEKDVTIINYTPGKDEAYTPRKNSGKWVISELDDETFIAQLFASNGELLLSSESYASYSSAKDAVENITQNGLNGNFIIDSDKKGRFFFKIRNAQKLTLCVGETYSQLTACQSAIESVFGFLKTAKLAEEK